VCPGLYNAAVNEGRAWWLGPAVVALALRLAGAVSLRPWHDEYFTAWVAGLPWGKLLSALRWDSGPPLPYLLAKLGSLAGLPPLAAARGVSVLAGVAATVFLGKAAAIAFFPQAGRWAAWLWAVHPLAVMWGAEGRAYSLLSLAVALGFWAAARLAAGEGSWLPLAGALALGLYTHALGLLLVGATVVACWRRARLFGLSAALAALLLFAPWIPVMASQPPEAMGWVEAWRGRLSLVAFGPWRLLPPLAPWGATLEAPVPPVWAQGLAAAATLAATPWQASWVWWLVVVPVATLVGGAALGVPLFFPGRGEAVFLGAFLGLLGRGAEGWRKLLLLLLAAFGVAGSLWIVAAWRAAGPRPEVQLAARLLREGQQGVVVTTGWWWLDLRANLPSGWEVVHLPRAAERHPGWYLPGKEKPSPTELAELAERIRQVRQRGLPVAFLLTPGLAEAEHARSLALQAGASPAGQVVAGSLWITPAGP